MRHFYTRASLIFVSCSLLWRNWDSTGSLQLSSPLQTLESREAGYISGLATTSSNLTLHSDSLNVRSITSMFEKMEREKMIHLTPDSQALRRVLTRESFKTRVVAEEKLQEINPNYFIPQPQWDPTRGGVAIFSNVFILGDPPIIYDGNVAYEPGSCVNNAAGNAVLDSYFDTVPQNVTISLTPSYNYTDEIDILISQWHSEDYYHAIIESLPRLMYVREFVMKHLEKVNIINRGGHLQYQQRHQTLFNPVLFKTMELPRWYAFGRPQFLFSRKLLIPTGSTCHLQSEPGKQLRQLFTQYLKDKTSRNDKLVTILLQHRSKDGTRWFVNGDELSQALTKTFQHCCQIVNFFGSQNLVDQAIQHQNADIIVGPHGAGLSNILFSNPQRLKGMVENHPERYLPDVEGSKNECHQETAKALGVNSTIIYSGDGDMSSPFHADIPKIVEAVRALL